MASWGIGDIPVAGDLYKGTTGDPEGIKDAYNKQIQASKDSQQKLMDFLMGQKGNSLAFYGPLQHMFNASYGTEGIQAPQTPGVPGSGPLSRMYGGR